MKYEEKICNGGKPAQAEAQGRNPTWAGAIDWKG